MSKNNETIGQRIRRLRLEHGWSQEELGKKIDLQRAAINKIETGATANLKQSHIIGLSEAFNVTPIYIMGWENPSSDTVALQSNTSDQLDALTTSIYQHLGSERLSLLEDLLSLNEQGITKVHDYIQDLIATEKYTL